MANSLFAVEHFNGKFVELITKLSMSDTMPGYTASHSAWTKTTNLRAKFYGKTALNGEMPVNKYQNNINRMS